jgi:outer membrane protein
MEVKTGLRIVAAPLMALLASVCVWAQAAPAPAPQKIGVINMQQALVSTNDGKKAIADLRAKYGPRDQEFQKRGQEIQAKTDQYKRTQATLSDEQKAKMEADIASLTRALQRDSDDSKQDLDQDQQRVLNDLGGKIMQVLTRYATDNSYALVFDVSGQPNNILFGSSAIDITRDIIALYDKAAPVTPTAPPSASAAPVSKPAAAPAKP